MNSVFGLYQTFEEAREGIHDLLDRLFEVEKMNVILQADVVKGHLKGKLERADLTAREKPLDLDRMVAELEPVSIADAGSVYAAGDMAGIMAKTASSADPESGGGLKSVLIDFGIPEDMAEGYVEGIRKGKILFWVFTSDIRASEAAKAMKRRHASRVASRER